MLSASVRGLVLEQRDGSQDYDSIKIDQQRYSSSNLQIPQVPERQHLLPELASEQLTSLASRIFFMLVRKFLGI